MVEAKKPARALEHLETANRIYEAITGAIAAISAILAFIDSHGGPIAILVQIGILGFALYISLFLALPLALGINDALEKATRRTSTETATLVIAVGALVVMALVVRFGLFYDGIGTDFDAIGTTFTALVGIAVLAAPFVVLWWTKGSQPAR